jgi:hypothetical protein
MESNPILEAYLIIGVRVSFLIFLPSEFSVFRGSDVKVRCLKHVCRIMIFEVESFITEVQQLAKRTNFSTLLVNPWMTFLIF